MIKVADIFEPMGPFKIAKAKDIGIEVDGIEKSLQETFDNLDFENLGKEIEKVNELPDWEAASENKLYVVKSSSEPVTGHTKIWLLGEPGERPADNEGFILVGSNDDDNIPESQYFLIFDNNVTENDLVNMGPLTLRDGTLAYGNHPHYMPSTNNFYLRFENESELQEALNKDPSVSYDIFGLWVKFDFSSLTGAVLHLSEQRPTYTEANNLRNADVANGNEAYFVVTEQSQSNESGKLQIYLKNPTTENSWLTLKSEDKPQKEITVDQEFDPESENPQSGVAVQDAIKLKLSQFDSIPQNLQDNQAFLYIGETNENFKKGHTYQYNDSQYTDLTQQQIDGVLNNLEVYDEEACYFSDIVWNNTPSNFNSRYIWTDGDNIYYSYYESSNDNQQYVLDKETKTWNLKIWNIADLNLDGDCVWTDGNSIYLSNGYNQYVLDKENNTWSLMNWKSPSNFYGGDIWTDGDNIYLSYNGSQFVLNGNTWASTPFSNLPSNFYAYCVWTDGNNTYHSFNGNHFILNGYTWTRVTFTNLPSDFNTRNIWTDGDNTYYSDNSNQYVLDKSTRTWTSKTWNGISSFSGKLIWKDGDNIYLSDSKQYKHKIFKLRLKA